MRITVLGAGPAGLYFAILAKRADPAHDITVLERNPPDATFGWGVVLSAETMGELRDADGPSWDAIDDALARWTTIDIRYRGRLLRSRGHVFSAISRVRLLGILQRRAAELGVELRFEEEVDDVDALTAAADLVVAADGVNSTVRAGREEVFGTELREHSSRYVWFGTDLVFDAFTFIFRETEHGLFQVHGYPFDAERSTFIVECPDDVWRRAGLDAASEEESIAFCERLFSDALGPHRLLSNRSQWLRFVTVRNRSWHDGNLVLLGDAAHTAHFSIGSGTKLAMEDAISLAAGLERHGEHLEAAFADYELERQPVVERFQEAATESALYFEQVERYASLEPIQFAFNLLTRSGRISYTNLTLRDPEFVRSLDSWFADGPGRLAPPPMFAPLRTAGTTLANRVAETTVEEDALPDGRPSAADRERLVALARSGAALVLTPLVAATLEGRITPATATLHDGHVEAWREVVDGVHEAGAAAGVLLGHAGRRGATRPRAAGTDLPLRSGAWPLLAASALPYRQGSAVPRAMTADDMARVRDAFAAAAARAAAAGFDALELDCAYGYLLAGFLSPLTNVREDEYGGDLEQRLRYPLEVFDAVRDAWPDDRLLAVRLTVSDWAPRGIGPADAGAAARAFAERGAQLIHATAGQTVADDRPEYRRGFLTRLADRVRSDAGVPVLVGGYLTTGDEINTIVGAGRADLCILEA